MSILDRAPDEEGLTRNSNPLALCSPKELVYPLKFDFLDSNDSVQHANWYSEGVLFPGGSKRPTQRVPNFEHGC